MNESATNLATDNGFGQEPEIHFKSSGRGSNQGPKEDARKAESACGTISFAWKQAWRVDKRMDAINSSRVISLRRKEQTATVTDRGARGMI